MKWQLILILMLLSGNLYVEGQNDLESVAEEYLKEGEALSEPLILSDEENTYTVFFYMEEDELKGAIVFQNDAVVMDADLHKRILEFSLIFKYSDFEQLVSQYNSFEEKKKEMAKYLKDFEEAFHFDISTGEKISMMENRDYARYYRKTKSDYNDFSENFIFSIKDYVTNAEEGDISSISFLLVNKEEILKSLDSLEDSYIKFTKDEFKLMEIELELLVKNLMELLTILSGEQVTTGEQATIDITLEKEIIEKEQKEFKEKIAYFKDSLESLVPAFLAEKVEELTYDFFATRVPPKIELEIVIPEKAKIGDSIGITCTIKNAGKTYANNVDLIFKFPMDLTEETIIEGIGENSEVDLDENEIKIKIERINPGEEKNIEFSIGTKKMKQGSHSIVTKATYKGIYGEFETSVESQILLEKSYGYIYILLFAGIMILIFVFLKRTFISKSEIDAPKQKISKKEKNKKW